MAHIAVFNGGPNVLSSPKVIHVRIVRLPGEGKIVVIHVRHREQPYLGIGALKQLRRAPFALGQHVSDASLVGVQERSRVERLHSRFPGEMGQKLPVFFVI